MKSHRHNNNHHHNRHHRRHIQTVPNLEFLSLNERKNETFNVNVILTITIYLK